MAHDPTDDPAPNDGADPAEMLPADESEDEEIPRPVMIAIVAIVLIAALLYTTLGGGHNHLH